MVIRLLLALLALGLLGWSILGGGWTAFAFALAVLCVAFFPRRRAPQPATALSAPRAGDATAMRQRCE